MSNVLIQKRRAVVGVFLIDLVIRHNRFTALVLDLLTAFCFLCYLKRPQVIASRGFPRIDYALITAKTQVKIHFVQYLNCN